MKIWNVYLTDGRMYGRRLYGILKNKKECKLFQKQMNPLMFSIQEKEVPCGYLESLTRGGMCNNIINFNFLSLHKMNGKSVYVRLLLPDNVWCSVSNYVSGASNIIGALEEYHLPIFDALMYPFNIVNNVIDKDYSQLGSGELPYPYEVREFALFCHMYPNHLSPYFLLEEYIYQEDGVLKSNL